MKNKYLLIIISSLLLIPTSLEAYNNTLTEKIDSIFSERYNDLNNINPQLPNIAENYTGEKKQLILFLHQYLNYKFQNENFYSQEVPVLVKSQSKALSDNSFTGQDRLEKLKNLQKEYQIYSIENSYIEFQIFIEEISILLNHQNFKKAEEKVINYFIENEDKLYFIIEEAEYIDFSVMIQFLKWSSQDIKIENLLEKRWLHYPAERNTIYNKVRIDGYTGLICSDFTILNKDIDLIDMLFCKLLNDSITLGDIEDLNKYNSNIQVLSDKVNFYSYLQGNTQEYFKEQEEIGKEIISSDKHFINGYITLLSIYDNLNQCATFDIYYEKLVNNYIGDESRKQDVFGRIYNNCTTK